MKKPKNCPNCNGQTEFNGSGGVTCFFCGYDELPKKVQKMDKNSMTRRKTRDK